MAKYIDTGELKDKIRPYYDKVLHQEISDDEKLAKHDIISDIMWEINNMKEDIDISKLRPLHIDSENVEINLVNAMELYYQMNKLEKDLIGC